MHRALSPLVMLIALTSPRVFAIGVPKSCQVRSAELKLGRECYTGDMRLPDDSAMFVGTDESSRVDLNYCFNALVAPYPTQGATFSVLVLKDDAKGLPVARTYSVGVAQLAASLGRVPSNHKAQVMSLAGLKAQCYAKNFATDKCSKGFFGWGGSDLPFAITLENALTGYVVKGGVRDRTIIDMPGVPSVAARGISPPAQTLDWLTGQVRTRLINRARKDLATVAAQPTAITRDKLRNSSSQFQFCRLAFDGLNRARKRPSSFTPAEEKVFEDLDAQLRDPVPPAATAAVPAAPALPTAALPTAALPTAALPTAALPTAAPPTAAPPTAAPPKQAPTQATAPQVAPASNPTVPASPAPKPKTAQTESQAAPETATAQSAPKPNEPAAAPQSSEARAPAAEDSAE